MNHVCSNPDCRAATSGPKDDPEKALSLGVAAHISAASEGGPRFSKDLTPAERAGIGNAIWLCQNCAKLVDSDVDRFTTEVLLDWKRQAESRAREEVGQTRREIDWIAQFSELERILKSNPESEDKWVNLQYPAQSGIGARLKAEGFDIRWCEERNEARRIDVEGWKPVVVADENGRQVRLKCKTGGGYSILLMRKTKTA